MSKITQSNRRKGGKDDGGGRTGPIPVATVVAVVCYSSQDVWWEVLGRRWSGVTRSSRQTPELQVGFGVAAQRLPSAGSPMLGCCCCSTYKWAIEVFGVRDGKR